MPLVTSQGYKLGANVLGAFRGGQDRARQQQTLGRQDRGRELAGTVLGNQAGRTPEMQQANMDELFKNDPNMALKVAKHVGARNNAEALKFGKIGALISSTSEQNLPQVLESIASQMSQYGASEKSIASITSLIGETPQNIFQVGKVMEGLAKHTQQGITARPTAASEKDRQFAQLQSMPSSTPEEKKIKKQYAQLIGAKGKQADLEEKVNTQKSVGDIKVIQDVKKAQKLANIKMEASIQTAKSKSRDEKLSGYIESGVESADNLISAKRSIELLDSVKTGGFDAAAIKAKQKLGIESGDEAELSYELGKAVLKQLKPTFGAAFTVNEMLELKAMESGLGKSVEGNRRILSKLVKVLERAAGRGMRAAKDQGDTFNHAEIQRALDVASPKKESGASGNGAISDEDLLKKYGG